MGLILGATSDGLGRHIYYLDKARAAEGVKLLRICEFILILTTVWLKISISLFLKRLLYVLLHYTPVFPAAIAMFKIWTRTAGRTRGTTANVR